ncbi:Ribosomal protein L11 methyltransferase [Streptomyces sp. RB5]|uniref:Ribosomal protein L11 methyltransferase n=1 Tax=Streptomyces smaragdinus TaxID=2585196 RepID=A0A7K0CD07_9ACTN|nr:50S ribosomal protein L11 methyltransferase [Streptomyces smaragdinus]MQY11223.1 Ribosomal protein L11 methyltransferase [Streptomyces smaragdinus]
MNLTATESTTVGLLPAAGPAPVDPLDPIETLLALGEEAMAQRQYERAYDLFSSAARIDARGGRFRRQINRAVRALVPRWHFWMMNDSERNQAYSRAIQQVVGEGQLVLDIGTGAGLLALLAARAGAEQVVTCEGVDVVATAARDIIGRNGYADRVTVVPSLSTDLRVGVDLPRRADVLVTEIFDCALLGEFALPAFRHARRELLTADATILPRGGRIFAQLVESPQLHCLNHVGEVEGFDFSPFASLTSMEYFSTILTNYRYRALTEPVEIFRFDFSEDQYPAAHTVEVVPRENGIAHAVALWFELDVADGVTLSNSPTDETSHWKQGVQTLAAPWRTEKGVPLRFWAAHDDVRVLVGRADEGRVGG